MRVRHPQSTHMVFLYSCTSLFITKYPFYFHLGCKWREKSVSNLFVQAAKCIMESGDWAWTLVSLNALGPVWMVKPLSTGCVNMHAEH